MGNVALCQPCVGQGREGTQKDVNQQSASISKNDIGKMNFSTTNSTNTSSQTNKNRQQNPAFQSNVNPNKETFLIPFEDQLRKDKKVTIDDFKLLKMLGKGSFGKVMLVEYKADGKLYAMKILQKKTIQTDRQKRHTKTERFVLEKMKHPFIIQLNFAFQNPEKLYLVLDYMNGGELFQHLQKYGRFKEKVAQFYAAEILLAIEHLHENNIFYRDLKPENVLMGEDGHIKIADFGLSFMTKTEEEYAKSMCGTPEYLAPEILLSKKGHDKTVDWWSLGALIYEMLTGLPPFYSEDKKKMFQNIISKPVPMPQYLSNKAISILRRLLVVDPCKRLGYGPTGSHDIKNHPFFEDLDWERLLNKQLKPPLEFDLKGPEDLKYFDKQITKQEPKDTPVHPDLFNNGNAAFSNFTYMGGKMKSKDDNALLYTPENQSNLSSKSQEFQIDGTSLDQ